ncbi:hypothetical protein HDV00_011019 [Rhizophlyctis rosea]|nr:hypothetical protein HDV00_011019 [Rhizophlyctis rosea]
MHLPDKRFKAHVIVDGQPLPEHNAQLQDAEASCWVVAEKGKTYSVAVYNEACRHFVGSALVADIYIDGSSRRAARSGLYYDEDENPTIVRGRRVGTTTMQLFTFSELEKTFAFTGSLSCCKHGLSTIRVELWKVQLHAAQQSKYPDIVGPIIINDEKIQLDCGNNDIMTRLIYMVLQFEGPGMQPHSANTKANIPRIAQYPQVQPSASGAPPVGAFTFGQQIEPASGARTTSAFGNEVVPQSTTFTFGTDVAASARSSTEAVSTPTSASARSTFIFEGREGAASTDASLTHELQNNGTGNPPYLEVSERSVDPSALGPPQFFANELRLNDYSMGKKFGVGRGVQRAPGSHIGPFGAGSATPAVSINSINLVANDISPQHRAQPIFGQPSFGQSTGSAFRPAANVFSGSSFGQQQTLNSAPAPFNAPQTPMFAAAAITTPIQQQAKPVPAPVGAPQAPRFVAPAVTTPIQRQANSAPAPVSAPPTSTFVSPIVTTPVQQQHGNQMSGFAFGQASSQTEPAVTKVMPQQPAKVRPPSQQGSPTSHNMPNVGVLPAAQSKTQMLHPQSTNTDVTSQHASSHQNEHTHPPGPAEQTVAILKREGEQIAEKDPKRPHLETVKDGSPSTGPAQSADDGAPVGHAGPSSEQGHQHVPFQDIFGHSAEECEALMDAGACFACKERGHIFKECPKRTGVDLQSGKGGGDIGLYGL